MFSVRFGLCVLFILSSALRGAAQEAGPLALSRVPLRADAPQLFAPRGWTIETRVNGDLNRDRVPDAALVLVENKAAKNAKGDPGDPGERSRALVVLLREGKGWRRVGFNNSLLLGTRDGGAFYGVSQTPVEVHIKRGVLLVNEDNGSRETTETTHKFRLDRRTRRLYLIGLELIENDRLSNHTRSESTNFLTGIKKTTLIQGETEHETQRSARVNRKLRTLESVKVDERHSG